MRLVSIGAGNMATAIIKAVIAAGRFHHEDVGVFDICADKYVFFKKLGVICYDTLHEAVDSADLLLLAVKPQDYDNLLLDLRPLVTKKKIVFITIAAGISTSHICTMLQSEVPCVRVMPNTPLLIGYGATAICRNQCVNDKLYTFICGLFASAGHVVSLPEEQMNAVISVNSTSPAYVYYLAKAMIDSAVKQGIEEKIATDLVYRTLQGASEMLLRSDKSPQELIAMVASPKGTTEAALRVLDQENVHDGIHKAMLACTNRADELSK